MATFKGSACRSLSLASAQFGKSLRLAYPAFPFPGVLPNECWNLFMGHLVDDRRKTGNL